jgi:hypothetical protein
MRHLGWVFLLGFAMLAVGMIVTLTFFVELRFPLVQSLLSLLLLLWGSQLVSAAFAEYQRRHRLHP